MSRTPGSSRFESSGSSALTALAETSEAESLLSLMTGMTESARERMAVATERIGGGVATSAINDPSRFWSRVIGLGVTEPVTAAIVDEILDFYIGHGNFESRFQIAPALLPPDWDAICARRGIAKGSSWYKMACKTVEFRPGTTSLRITKITPENAELAASVLARGFGFPEDDMTGIYAPALTSGLFEGYAAWDGNEMVAAAALSITGETGEMYGAATLPAHRGKGAQTALLAARAAAAKSAGCTWLISETWMPAPGDSNPSFDNMARSGFAVLYERPNWLWTGPA